MTPVVLNCLCVNLGKELSHSRTDVDRSGLIQQLGMYLVLARIKLIAAVPGGHRENSWSKTH